MVRHDNTKTFAGDAKVDNEVSFGLRQVGFGNFIRVGTLFSRVCSLNLNAVPKQRLFVYNAIINKTNECHIGLALPETGLLERAQRSSTGVECLLYRADLWIGESV